MSRSTEVDDGSSDDIAVELPVRTRRILTAHGVRSAVATVHCPRRAATVDADDCFRCPRFTAVVPADGGAAIRCDGGERGRAATLPLFALSADATPVHGVMTRHVPCVTADVEVPALLAYLDREAVSEAPVVEGDGTLLGVVARHDAGLTVPGDDDWAAQPTVPLRPHPRPPTPRTAADIMTPVVFSMPEDATLDAVAGIMAAAGLHRLTIVDDRGRVVGVVSSLDIVRWVASTGGLVALEP